MYFVTPLCFAHSLTLNALWIAHTSNIALVHRKKGIMLNRDRFQFCQTKVHYAGLQLAQTGYSVSDEITAAIANFPTPTSRTDLCSFLICGLINQLASSTNSVASIDSSTFAVTTQLTQRFSVDPHIMTRHSSR